MPRNKIRRCVRFCPGVTYFKPQGIPLRSLEEIVLEPDELEALKLYEIDGLDQISAAKAMNISQPTFARTLDKAHTKTAKALIEGKAIRIQNS